MLKKNFLKNIIRIIIHKILLLIIFLRCSKNYIQNIIFRKIDNFYIPNLFIKNVIMVDPMKIKYVNSIPMKFRKSTKFILNFDWDKKNKIVNTHEKKHHTYVTCKELFIKKKKFKECKEYYFFKKKIKKNGEYKNCKNDKDIILYLQNLVSLFKSIKKFGVKNNINNNCEFMIDKNFNLVKINSGNHRFSISRVLKLSKIPAEVKIIHAKCLEKNTKSKNYIKKLNNILKFVENKYK